MASEIPGQMKFSDEEMGIKVPVKTLDQETPITPEAVEVVSTALTEEERELVYKYAKESEVTDSGAKKGGKQIGLIDLLDRELAGSVHKAKNLGELAHTTVSRISDPDELRALAIAIKEHHAEILEQQIADLRKEQDELWERNDRAGGSNPRFQSDNIALIRRIDGLTEEKNEKVTTANEIAYFLTKLADALEKQNT